MFEAITCIYEVFKAIKNGLKLISPFLINTLNSETNISSVVMTLTINHNSFLTL